MRVLLRLILWPLASRWVFLLAILSLGIAVYDGALHPLAGAAAGVVMLLLFGSASRWIARDRITVDPYRARRRLKKPTVPDRAPPPAGLAALPMTQVELVLPAPKRADAAGPPEMMSRLPTPLNRMVVEGLGASGTDNRP